MLTINQEPSQIVELPVIAVDGIVRLIDPDMAILDEKTLKDIAFAMNGEFLYLKVRATYTPVEQQLCTHKECFRPAVTNTLVCGDH